MRVLPLLLVLAACAAPPPADVDAPPFVPANDPPHVGTVTAVDLEPMAVDGDAVVSLRSGFGPVEVHVPARMGLCAAEGLNLVVELAVGDRVEVVGEVSTSGRTTVVRPCVEPWHRLTRLRVAADSSRAGPGVFRGIYTTGFEVSAFRPCDRPDEEWWLTPNRAFGDAYDAIYREHRGEGGRGLVLVIETTVEGTLSPEGWHGHLGTYSRELTVTGVRGLVHRATNPAEAVTCE